MEVALCLELLDLRRAVPLGELLSVWSEHVRHMRVRRDVPAERAPNEEVLWRRGKPILATEDMRDAHNVVVDHDSEVVRGKAVRLQ
jgi:hypothetical protein